MNSFKKRKPARRKESQLTQLSTGWEDNWTLPIFKGVIAEDTEELKRKLEENVMEIRRASPTSSLEETSLSAVPDHKPRVMPWTASICLFLYFWFSVWRPSRPQTPNPPVSASQGLALQSCATCPRVCCLLSSLLISNFHPSL